MLAPIAEKDSKIRVLKSQLSQDLQGTSIRPGVLESLIENTHPKAKNSNLKKKIIDLTQQMINELTVEFEAEKSNWSNNIFNLKKRSVSYLLKITL